MLLLKGLNQKILYKYNVKGKKKPTIPDNKKSDFRMSK